MMQIEKNIPQVDKVNLSSIIKQMEIGDSIVVPSIKRNGMAQRFLHWGYKCKSQKISSNEVRVWRIA